MSVFMKEMDIDMFGELSDLVLEKCHWVFTLQSREFSLFHQDAVTPASLTGRADKKKETQLPTVNKHVCMSEDKDLQIVALSEIPDSTG